MRNCPKCGAFEGDGLTQFCLADGSRLLEVDPASEKWSQAEQVLREQNKTLRRTQRRLRWRRMLKSVVTMMIVTTVVFVTAINAVIYLKPPQEPKIVKAAEPPASPGTEPTTDITTLGGQPTTDITDIGKPIVVTDVEPPKESCTAADKIEISNALLKKHRQEWLKKIKSDPPDVPIVKGPAAPIKGEAKLETEVTYKPTVGKRCDSAAFVANYAWQITTRFNGKEEKVIKPMKKTFSCHKGRSGWSCP